MKKVAQLGAAALAVVFLISCSHKNNQQANIVGNHFKNLDFKGEKPKFVALLKLNLPPLLSELKVDKSGRRVVDQGLLTAIQQEQQQTLKQLKRISPDIKVLYTYQRVLNALAIIAPQDKADEISKLNVKKVVSEERFALPLAEKTQSTAKGEDIVNKNSMTFMGVDKVHQITVKTRDGKSEEIRGQGVRVGVIDTGIDYTHSMFGGAGTPEAYKSVQPSEK